jgi:hypothetical protein
MFGGDLADPPGGGLRSGSGVRLSLLCFCVDTFVFVSSPIVCCLLSAVCCCPAVLLSLMLSIAVNNRNDFILHQLDVTAATSSGIL